MVFCSSPMKAHESSSPTMDVTFHRPPAVRHRLINNASESSWCCMEMFGRVPSFGCWNIRQDRRSFSRSGAIPRQKWSVCIAGWPSPTCVFAAGVLKLCCIPQTPALREVQNTECLSISSCRLWLSSTFCWVVTVLRGGSLECSPRWLPLLMQCPGCPAWLIETRWGLDNPCNYGVHPPLQARQQAKRTSSLGFHCVLFLLPHNAQVPAWRWNIA